MIKIFNCDVFDGLKKIESESIDCVMSSPPYWGLRDYGVEGQIGLEEHPKDYIKKMVDVFKELKRVLKPSGSIWWNVGDTYYNIGSSSEKGKHSENSIFSDREFQLKGKRRFKSNWLQSKQLMLMPHRLAIALQNEGWILRNTIVWHKPSHMPSSVKDRLTCSYEYVFHFVKQKKYFYDLDAIREPHKQESIGRANRNIFADGPWAMNNKNKEQKIHELGKNPSDFWSINPQPYPEAHFACFPETLCLKPLKATVPKEICVKCGKQRERLVEVRYEQSKNRWGKKATSRIKETYGTESKVGFRPKEILSKVTKTVGWTACGCNAGFKAGVVLDPFVGSGTTLKVAQDLGLNAIGIELNKDYVKLIKKRLRGHESQQALTENLKVV